jgi:hypothetical protein
LKLLVISLVILLLLVAAVWRASRVMHSMTVVADSAKEMRQAKPETKTRVVVEIADVDGNGLIHGTLLEKKTEELYARTQTSVTAQWSSNTKMVMGNREDVRKGAVVHITGERGSDGRIEAEQIVILTGYVKVS